MVGLQCPSIMGFECDLIGVLAAQSRGARASREARTGECWEGALQDTGWTEGGRSCKSWRAVHRKAKAGEAGARDAKGVEARPQACTPSGVQGGASDKCLHVNTVSCWINRSISSLSLVVVRALEKVLMVEAELREVRRLVSCTRKLSFSCLGLLRSFLRTVSARRG